MKFSNYKIFRIMFEIFENMELIDIRLFEIFEII